MSSGRERAGHCASGKEDASSVGQPSAACMELPATGYLVLLHEPDGGCPVCPAVLTAHQWLLLLHPVLQL